MVMATHLGKCTKNHWTISFKKMNFRICDVNHISIQQLLRGKNEKGTAGGTQRRLRGSEDFWSSQCIKELKTENMFNL